MYNDLQIGSFSPMLHYESNSEAFVIHFAKLLGSNMKQFLSCVSLNRCVAGDICVKSVTYEVVAHQVSQMY